ncbi:hypothetical protein WA026_020040 [Henosepilachna vigintioctopunctata]
MKFASYRDGLPNFNRLEIELNNTIFIVSSADVIKYLGITIDSHLRWDEHSDNIIKKIRSLFVKFKQLRNVCEESELFKIYYGLVQPHLSYGVLAWGSLADCHYRHIEIVQKFILKIIYRKNSTFPTDDLFNMAEIFTVRQLYARALLIYQYERRKQQPVNERVIVGNLRDGTSLRVPFMKKTIGQKSFSYLSPILYNEISSIVRNCSSIKSFKRYIKKWIWQYGRNSINNFLKRNKFC